MKLHWSPKSPFVRKVMIVAHELGLADRMTLQRSVAIMSRCNPNLMADNPLNKIPTLVLEDGTVLVDARVIEEYLVSLVPTQKMLPGPGPDRWWVLSKRALASGLLDLLILWRNEREKPLERQTVEWLDAFAAKTAATLDHFESAVGEFEGRPFGLAHVGLGSALSYLDFRFKELGWRGGRPRLAAWHRQFEARPSVRATEIVND